MARDVKDWNFDRMCTAQALLVDVQNDIMRCLHSGEVNDVVRERMQQRLWSAHESISRLALCHEEETS